MEPASGSVKKLDKKALEGLDARAESTKVPKEDMKHLVEGPPSENETATSAKRSQSKPEHGRGPLRESRQAKKVLVYKGVITQEEAESLSAEQVMDMVKKCRKGTPSCWRSCCSSWKEQEGGPAGQALRRHPT